MNRKRPSRVTITLPPRSLRASSSTWNSWSRSLSEWACCSLSSAISTRHSSWLRGVSSRSFTGATLSRNGLLLGCRLGAPSHLDLDHAALGAEVEDRGGADLALRAPGLVDVAADRHLWPLRLDRLEDRLAAEVVA